MLSWHKELWKHPIDTLFAIPSSIVNSQRQLKQQEGTRDCRLDSTGTIQYFRKTLKISSTRLIAEEVRSFSAGQRARTLSRSVWTINLWVSRAWRFLCFLEDLRCLKVLEYFLLVQKFWTIFRLMSLKLIHSSSSLPYPFQRTRYWLLPVQWAVRNSSTRLTSLLPSVTPPGCSLLQPGKLVESFST